MLAKGSRGKNWRRGLQPGAHRPLWRGEDADAGVGPTCVQVPWLCAFGPVTQPLNLNTVSCEIGALHRAVATAKL